uniref:Uncharacterized protein n=1 Tax=Lepeophtheirus salmonis TaxID=72036 RepID=A0A0K2TTL1_LEPSM
MKNTRNLISNSPLTFSQRSSPVEASKITFF